MNEPNAYRFCLNEDWADIFFWWDAISNPFPLHVVYPLAHGDYLLMVDVSPETDELLESAPWCDSYSLCRVDSPQVGDAEPETIHESVDAGEQLLWVS